MKWLKGILIFFGLIILLFGIGLVLIVVYKKEILAEVSRQLKDTINADVTIRDADITLFSEFPNFTLRLEDTGIKDLFQAKTVLVNVVTYKLFYKEIEFRSIKIIDGDFFVFRTKSGYSNIDIFKKKDTVTVVKDSTARDFRLTNEKILFKNVRFQWHDSLRRKFIGLTLKNVDSEIRHWDSLIAFRMNGQIDFEQLTFNERRGSFLKDMPTNVSLTFDFHPDSALLRLHPSTVSLHESELNISGVFDFSPRKRINLEISSDNLLYSEGMAVIPQELARKLSLLTVIKPFAVRINLEAPMQPGLPSVVVSFDLKDNIFKSNVVTITDLSLNGVMTNHEDPSKEFDNKNSTVKLQNVLGKIDELPFEAHAILSDFDDLMLEIFSKHKVTLPMLNREVDTTSIRFTGGDFVSEFHYKGKLNEYFDQETGTYRGELEGKATVEKGAFTLVTRKLDFKDINMMIHFTEDTMWIDKLGVAIGKTSANIQGTIINYVPYFTHSVTKGRVKLKIASPNIDMGNFLTKKSSKKPKQSKADKKKVSDMLDKIFTTLSFDVELSIDKLKNKSFAASNISGKIKLANNSLAADNIKMNFGGGRLNFSMTMDDLQNDVNPIEVKATASNIAVKDLFRSFNNFNQKNITDQNLEGAVSFDTKFKVKINDDFNLMLPTFRGDMNWVVKNGRLINVEAIHNMSNFLFRRRDFDDVKFAQINGQCKLTHRYMDISRMEIQSTVLSIFLEGRYSLDNDTNLQVQVPLSNLKKRNKDFVPKNVGVDAKVGPSVYLLAKTDSNGKTDLSYNGIRMKEKSDKPSRAKKKKER
jgi:hypothetical protein